MGKLLRVGRVLLALVDLAVASAFACLLIDSTSARAVEVLSRDSLHVAALIFAGILVLQALVMMVAALFERAEVECIHPDGDREIEVSLAALESVARIAAADPDLLVESVEARVCGRTDSEVKIRLELIALMQADLRGLAREVQERVRGACEAMLGADGVSVSVRFLKSKTVTVTKEVLR